ncbi:MAG: pyruvate kinase [Candidatus Omnitrophota bacterium]|jgi:pyruvate kinase
MVKTKIIATLGPATDSEAVLRKMIIAGLDVVRLNFSHDGKSQQLKRVNLIRRLNHKLRRAIKIMQDLEGFRIRIGRLNKPLALSKRQVLYLTQEELIGEKPKVPFDYRGPLNKFKRGSLIYIDDGKIILKIKGIGRRSIKTEVIIGGVLEKRKGINIPGIQLDYHPITPKDRNDIEFAIEYKLDYLAQSFVRSAKDIASLREIIKPRNPECKIFAKVESREALVNIDAIIRQADGIIIARGDLGICVPIYRVPVIQKELIKKCRRANKPVVVATQMLDSMTTELIPTRAEVTDVAGAIFDQANFVLLSGETAVGRHPSKVVDLMNKIIKYAEEYMQRGGMSDNED